MENAGGGGGGPAKQMRLQLHFPDGTKEEFSVSTGVTVDQVKAMMYRSRFFEGGAAAVRGEHVLSMMNQDDVLDVEFAKVLSYKSALEGLLKHGEVQLRVVPRSQPEGSTKKRPVTHRGAVSESMWRHQGYTIDRMPDRHPISLQVAGFGELILLVDSHSSVDALGDKLRALSQALRPLEDEARTLQLEIPVRGLHLRGAVPHDANLYTEQCVHAGIIPEYRLTVLAADEAKASTSAGEPLVAEDRPDERDTAPTTKEEGDESDSPSQFALRSYRQSIFMLKATETRKLWMTLLGNDPSKLSDSDPSPHAPSAEFLKDPRRPVDGSAVDPPDAPLSTSSLSSSSDSSTALPKRSPSSPELECRLETVPEEEEAGSTEEEERPKERVVRVQFSGHAPFYRVPMVSSTTQSELRARLEQVAQYHGEPTSGIATRPLYVWGTDVLLSAGDDGGSPLFEHPAFQHLWLGGQEPRLLLLEDPATPSTPSPTEDTAAERTVQFRQSRRTHAEAAAFRTAVSQAFDASLPARPFSGAMAAGEDALRGREYGPSYKFLLKLVLPAAERATAASKTVPCTADDTGASVLAKPSVRAGLGKAFADRPLLLKRVGVEAYVRPSTRLLDVVDVQEQLRRGETTVSLAVGERDEESLEEVASAGLGEAEAYEALAHAEPPEPVRMPSAWVFQPFEVHVEAAERLPRTVGGLAMADTGALLVEVSLWSGGAPLCEALCTPALPVGVGGGGGRAQWGEWVRSRVPIRALPRSARLGLTVMYRDAQRALPLGGVSLPLFDHRGVLASGPACLRLWPDVKANPIGLAGENHSSENAPRLWIRFHTYPELLWNPISLFSSPENNSLKNSSKNSSSVHPSSTTNGSNAGGGKIIQPSREVIIELEKLLRRDPLYRLSGAEKAVVWSNRMFLKALSHDSVVLVASAVDVLDRGSVAELHRLVRSWGRIRPVLALRLLDSRHADEVVRAYAVDCLRVLSDDHLSLYLLQLVQALKYEPYHLSPLVHFLLDRALRSRMRIGHVLFWHLASEMHSPAVAERYGLVLEAYLRRCGGQRDVLLAQLSAVLRLNAVAREVKAYPQNRRNAVLPTLLADAGLPSVFRSPLDPAVALGRLLTERCRCMDSAKAPLRLVFENGDPLGSPVSIIFKSGDDLRQDQLTLQMLRLMTRIWRSEFMELPLIPYGCISTGDGMGMIEVVTQAQTTAEIQKAAGGVTAAFKSTPLAHWIRDYNKTDAAYQRAVLNFTKSCAGYCVATYVLGIGDRHNDNIMVREDGHLFHIDFGHFLGNYKKFLMMRREKAPFVLTPEFAFVMGGEKGALFAEFSRLCCAAYVSLRRQAHEFITLFSLMVSTGIPELKDEDDIDYLHKAFALDLDSDAECEQHFVRLIGESLNTKRTQINFAVHILAHRN